jgi:methionyl-tRNA formyltransferase
MRLAFAGTAPFAEAVLRGLLDTRYAPVVVVTNPDRPKGRRGSPQPPVVKVAAAEHGLPVLQPETLAGGDALRELLDHGPDALVACAYGKIVGRAVLEALPCLVVHPSLVPRWRGAAPVERALMAGETELGVTVLKMAEGVDEGPVAETRPAYVPREADAGQAYATLAPLAVEALQATLDTVESGEVRWVEQGGAPTYAAKIASGDRVIDWSRPRREVVDLVRALSPHIGALTELLGERTLVWRAAVAPSAEGATGGAPAVSPGAPAVAPGVPVVLPGARLLVGAGDGAIEVLELQRAGGRRMSAAEFLRGAGRALGRP